MLRFKNAFNFVQNLVTSGMLPNAVFGVTAPDGIVDLQAFDANPESIYHVYSVTKPFIGLAMCQLWERGAINLHDPVTKYIPDFGSEHLDTVTLWHLLTHTSGIDQTLNDALKMPPDDATMPYTPHQILVTAPLQYPCGAYKRYNNLAFVAMQEIIERVTGATLDEYLAREIWAPLDMHDTSFRKHEEVSDRVMPTHHHELINLPRYLKLQMAAAGLFTTAPDLLKLAQAMLNGGSINAGQRIIGRLTLEAMTTPQTIGIPPLHADDFVGAESGLTWRLPINDRSLIVRNCYGHDGWAGAMFWVYPQHGVAFTLMTNVLDIARQIDLARVHNVVAACL
jgi:CubicO group peptidase (beta-lactamase class C family)